MGFSRSEPNRTGTMIISPRHLVDVESLFSELLPLFGRLKGRERGPQLVYEVSVKLNVEFILPQLNRDGFLLLNAVSVELSQQRSSFAMTPTSMSESFCDEKLYFLLMSSLVLKVFFLFKFTVSRLMVELAVHRFMTSLIYTELRQNVNINKFQFLIIRL